MSDVSILAPSTEPVPLDYTIPGAQEILPKSVSASMDGTGAGSAWYPCLQVLDPSGHVMFSAVGTTLNAAGASADVSWFPHLAEPSGIPTPLTPGTWTRVAQPLISPSQAWEHAQVQEPDVHYESGTWKMWYSAAGNAGTEAIGYATCSGDPRIPANWTKNAGNPVIGAGGSGIAGWAGSPTIYKLAGTYHCFYYDTAGGGNMKRTTSADGITWAAPTTAFASGSLAGTHGWAGIEVWYDGTQWWALINASLVGGGGPPWGCFLFTNTAITNDGGWTVQNGGNGLTTLTTAGYSRGYGLSPNIAEIDGVDSFQIGSPYVFWFHNQKLTSSHEESEVYHAASIDPGHVTWTPASPFDLTHDGGPYELDQVADPSVLEVAGTSYLFYTGDATVAPVTGYINLATFDGTLEQLLNGSQGGGTFQVLTSTGGSMAITDPTGPTVNIDVAPSGVTAGTYGSGSQSAQVTVGADGRLTAAANTDITVAPLTNPAVPDLIFTADGDVIMAAS